MNTDNLFSDGDYNNILNTISNMAIEIKQLDSGNLTHHQNSLLSKIQQIRRIFLKLNKMSVRKIYLKELVKQIRYKQKLERLGIANKFIKIISSYGRRFFYNEKKDKTAYIKMKNNKLYFVSEWTGKEIYLHYKYWTFHHGGTLRQLVESLKEYIIGREELPLKALGPWNYCNNDLWGYGENMEKVREECNKLI